VFGGKLIGWGNREWGWVSEAYRLLYCFTRHPLPPLGVAVLCAPLLDGSISYVGHSVYCAQQGAVPNARLLWRRCIVQRKLSVPMTSTTASGAMSW
jgi:hypothetical protein